MAGKPTIKGKITLEYLERFPKTPSRSLAKKIYKENKEAFKSVDDAQNKVRYYRGQYGKHSRKHLSTDKFKAKPSEFYNPYELPESEEAEWLEFEIPKSVNKLGIMSDVHIPYHNIKAVTSTLDYFKQKNVDGVLLNGDILDFYGLSRFEKDPRKRSFADELEDGRKFLKILRNEFDCPIYYKLGNHEERFESYLRVKAPELLDVSEFRLDILLRFGENRIQLIDDKRRIKFGKLTILHGHEFGRSVFSPVNPARGFYTRGKTNLIAGHHHQTSEHSEKDLMDNVVTCFSTGCLCEMHPGYMPVNKWNWGAAIAKRLDDEGNYKVNNFKIIDGKIY